MQYTIKAPADYIHFIDLCFKECRDQETNNTVSPASEKALKVQAKAHKQALNGCEFGTGEFGTGEFGTGEFGTGESGIAESGTGTKEEKKTGLFGRSPRLPMYYLTPLDESKLPKMEVALNSRRILSKDVIRIADSIEKLLLYGPRGNGLLTQHTEPIIRRSLKIVSNLINSESGREGKHALIKICNSLLNLAYNPSLPGIECSTLEKQIIDTQLDCISAALRRCAETGELPNVKDLISYKKTLDRYPDVNCADLKLHLRIILDVFKKEKKQEEAGIVSSILDPRQSDPKKQVLHIKQAQALEV